MKSQPGYPLPSGELGEDNIVCQLVYLPDRPEYWQAFYGALHYMTTWRAWERDDDKRGADAASNWREAFELTSECWRMTCLEDLKSDVAAILALLETNAGCCAENITYGDQTVYNTTIIVDVGDDPTHYGATEVADWDEWKEYLCFSANAWVDHLVSQANSLEIAMSVGGLTMALLAYVFGAVNFLLMRGDMNTSTLMLRLTNMAAGYAIALWSDASDSIEASREEIVCSVMHGSSMADAVEDALSSGIAWDLFFQFVDYGSAQAIMYEGGDGENYLEAELDDSCDCIDWGEFSNYTDWETGDPEQWDLNTGSITIGWGVDSSYGYGATFSNAGPAKKFAHELLNYAGHTPHEPGDAVVVNRVRWSMKFTALNASRLHLVLMGEGGDDTTIYEGELTHTWYEKTFSPGIKIIDGSANAVKFVGVGSFSSFRIDEVTIDYDIDLV